MSEINKSYRIRTDIGNNVNNGFISINTDLIQDYETLDILSVKLNSSEMYRLHNSTYGVVVGRVLANNGFGVPNAKLSIFITADSNDGDKVKSLYPFVSASSTNDDGVRYNLLPDEKVNDCHQAVGTFPNKRFMLDNDIILEVYDKYYKYTTRTNNSGDYLIMGVPVGTHTIHMDLDLSDCGILSQKPRDFIYKGYTVEQFENQTMFKSGTNYSELSQIFTQDQIVTVKPFWGNESLGEPIGITRADINISFKFEPTCVFIGCVASDNASNGITQKCMGTENMGNMEEMTTGSGTIEMIRKTPSGDIESFQIRGTQLINGDGVWCYQIPMNLDYMMTDEFGNMVPTDDPNKGIPTRTSVRFRISMQDNEDNLDFYYRAKVLVPHNPKTLRNGNIEDYDYEFGTYTRDDSFRDLFWDNVYTVKSYIPRFQKKKVRGWKDKRFTGIKNCNFFGNNNPIPYNNIRIRLPLMFTIMCAIIKCMIFLVSLFNSVTNFIGYFLAKLGGIKIFKWRPFGSAWDAALNMKLSVLNEGLCPDLENWYFAPILGRKIKSHKKYNLLGQTLVHISKEDGNLDETSIDYGNSESEDEVICLTTKTDYLISCMEMNLAMEYRVINFDFYNDWINGLIYVPRFRRYTKPKKKFLGFTISRAKVKGCMDDTKIFSKSRRYTQLCSISYIPEVKNGKYVVTDADTPLRSSSSKSAIKKANNFHKKQGINQFQIFGKRGGVCHEHTTSQKQHVYYMKPCEMVEKNTYTGKVILFATDIVLLGSLKSCDENGLPQAFKYLSSTSYVMPTNLALTNMETNGYLYANGKNTICAGKSNQLISDDTATDVGITRANPDNGLAEELMMYKNSGDSNIDAQYDGNELSDIVPITEAAGISWNYTGPGQGGFDESVMYQPGGHFLGLSCVNSQTNIKSCINLSRICEVGVNMSERKEDVGYLRKNSEGTEELVYIYSAPTGFISGSDIIGSDFRTMFATLNQNRLKATKLNPETGYYYYDFDFIKPLNFNGEFKYMVNKGNSYYNNGNGDLIADWKDVNRNDANIFKLLGINIETSERDDYDEEEILHTQTKTYETTSLDYYRFRFGLNNDDLTNKRDTYHNSHFLDSIGIKKVLPQYENSFYFYFGMKAGASAIDEFNKQFFGVCETSVLKQMSPSINAKVEDIDLCQGTGIVKIILDNIETPTALFSCTTDKGDGVEKVKLVDKDSVENGKPTLDNNKYVHEFELEFGKYHFDVIDANGELLSTDISVGVDLFNYDVLVSEFNVNYANDLINNDVRRPETKNIIYGGYVEVSNLTCDENYIDYVNSAVTLSIDGINLLEDECSGTIVFNGFKSENEECTLYVNSANTRYNLYLTYKCNTDKNPVEHKILMQTFEVRDGSSVELRMGYSDIPLYIGVSPSSSHTPNSLVMPLSGFDVVTKENFVRISANTNTDLYFGSDNVFLNNEINNDIDTDTNNVILHNWLKRLSTIKSTRSGVPFSNNIHVSRGDKVVWGSPQNEEETLNKIFSTEDQVDKYAGYSLDDESSYRGTEELNYYSAIGVDSDIVSGNFFAYLSGGSISNSNISNYPAYNSGYVFKSIPDGNLYYYVYTGETKDASYLSKPDGTINGVYYPSFIYPVIEKPFNVDVKFYIWEGLTLVRDENSDANPEISFQELAGRTEANIKNGVRFNGSLGSSDGSNGFKMSNIVIDQNNKPNDSLISVNGMDVTIVINDENNNSREVIVPATSKNNNVVYAIGVSGVSDVFYNISEGYPIMDETGFDFSQLVINTSNNFNYKDYFSDYITYEFRPGLGIVTTPKGDNGLGSFKIEKGTYTSDVGFICAQHVDSRDDGFLYLPKGNDKYIYIKLGSDVQPTYYVLCRYIKSGSYGDTYFENKEGELCIIKIDFYTDNSCRIYWSYNKNEDIDYENQSNKKNVSQRFKRVGGIKTNLDALLGYTDSGWNNEANSRKYLLYAEPVFNYRMRVTEKKNWLEYIETDRSLYSTIIKNNVYELDKDYIYYYVDKFVPQNLDSNDKMELYKIYPIFIYENNDSQDSLSFYYIKSNFNGKVLPPHPKDFSFSSITNTDQVKVEEIEQNKIDDGIVYLTLTHTVGASVEHNGDIRVAYSAIGENYLSVQLGDNYNNIYNLNDCGPNDSWSIQNDIFKITISGMCNIECFDDKGVKVGAGIPYMNGEELDHILSVREGKFAEKSNKELGVFDSGINYIEKTYLVEVQMLPGNVDKSTEQISTYINFLIKTDGDYESPITLSIDRLGYRNYKPILGYFDDGEFIEFKKVNDKLPEYESIGLSIYKDDYCYIASDNGEDKVEIWIKSLVPNEFETYYHASCNVVDSSNFTGNIIFDDKSSSTTIVDNNKFIFTKYNLSIKKANIQSYAVYEFTNLNPVLIKDDIATNRLVVYQRKEGQIEFSFNVDEITIPYYYDSNFKEYGVNLVSDVININDIGDSVSYKFETNDEDKWSINVAKDGNDKGSFKFIVGSNDVEEKYFKKNNEMLTQNELIATLVHDRKKYKTSVTINRKPLINLDIDNKTFQNINIVINQIYKGKPVYTWTSNLDTKFAPFVKTGDKNITITCIRPYDSDLYKGSVELSNGFGYVVKLLDKIEKMSSEITIDINELINVNKCKLISNTYIKLAPVLFNINIPVKFDSYEFKIKDAKSDTIYQLNNAPYGQDISIDFLKNKNIILYVTLYGSTLNDLIGENGDKNNIYIELLNENKVVIYKSLLNFNKIVDEGKEAYVYLYDHVFSGEHNVDINFKIEPKN